MKLKNVSNNKKLSKTEEVYVAMFKRKDNLDLGAYNTKMDKYKGMDADRLYDAVCKDLKRLGHKFIPDFYILKTTNE